MSVLLFIVVVAAVEQSQFNKQLLRTGKYGSKVSNRNVISTLFIYVEQSLITVVKLERMLLLRQ